MYNDQIFNDEIVRESSMLQEPEEPYNIDKYDSLDVNNSLDVDDSLDIDKNLSNDNLNDVNDPIDQSLPITTYFPPREASTKSKKKMKAINNKGDGTLKHCDTEFKPKTSTSSIAAHLQSNTPLSENQQIRIAYQLVAWIVEAMMSLNCINNVSFGIFAMRLIDGDQIEDFLRKVLAKWEIFDKLSVVITNNVSSIVKAIRQLGSTHLGCMAHTIHLAVTDGLKECENLIGHAKLLNNFLQLLELRDSISELATNLVNDPDRTIRADGNTLTERMLSNEEWKGLEELYQMENILTYPSIIEAHKTLRTSLAFRWDDPKMDGWLATFLDPRFKTLSIVSPTMQQETIQELRRRLELSQQEENIPITNQVSKTDMASFFGDEIESSPLSPVDLELQMYYSILEIPKYDPKDPLYEKYNPLK
ncbi:9834_t:CDS:2 [Cetraspora pellucida]|uniref:9834_t:CDS:1 n=1 Tax=Cetraspora pellucida TaxID=1433469 RepID=A0A9N9IUQ1_9GLOM|nr:9834_t:CDS:2 [Cetraspora pellucida]